MNITDQLARLDPARGISDDVVATPRARDALAAAMSGERPVRAPETKRSRRGLRATLVSLPLVAATTVAAVFAFGTAGTGTAFAGWQATPSRPSPAVAAQSVKSCAATWPTNPAAGKVDHPRTPFTERLVEQRGSFTYTVIGSADGWEATCFTQGPVSAPLMSQGFSGPLKAQPKPDGLVTNSVRQIQGDHQDQRWQEVTGKIGADVRSVVFLAHGTRVTATVQNGFFAAWWPDDQPRLHFGPPNPDVVITLKNGRHIIRAIQDFDLSPM